MGKSDSADAKVPNVLLLGGDGGYSGVPTYLEQLCTALQGLAKFTVIADRNEGGYDFAKGDITFHELEGMKTGLSVGRLWRAMRQLDTQISDHAPDLVWGHARMSLIQLRLLMILRHLRNKPVPCFAVTYHGLPFGPGHRRTFAGVSWVMERFFLTLAPSHQLHFLSSTAADYFKRRLGKRTLARHRCHVLTNCSRLGPLATRTKAAAPTILMTGRAGYQKNHAAAARLFAALPDDYRLILCGAGTKATEMAPMFDAVLPGLSKRVQFLGPIADIRPYLAQSDLFLLPSRYEGMPIAALEAFEAGLPVALSDIPGMAEILALHPMAVTLNPLAPETSAEEVVDVVQQIRSVPKANEAIRAVWADHFSYEEWQDRARELLAKLLAGNPKPDH